MPRTDSELLAAGGACRLEVTAGDAWMRIQEEMKPCELARQLGYILCGAAQSPIWLNMPGNMTGWFLSPSKPNRAAAFLRLKGYRRSFHSRFDKLDVLFAGFIVLTHSVVEALRFSGSQA